MLQALASALQTNYTLTNLTLFFPYPDNTETQLLEQINTLLESNKLYKTLYDLIEQKKTEGSDLGLRTLPDETILSKILKKLALLASEDKNLIADLANIIKNRDFDRLLMILLENTLLLKSTQASSSKNSERRQELNIVDAQPQDLADLMIVPLKQEHHHEAGTNQRFFLPSTSTQEAEAFVKQAAKNSEEKASLNRGEI